MTTHVTALVLLAIAILIYYWDRCWLPWVDCSGIGYDHYVELTCPESEDDVIATEHTESVDVDDTVNGGTVHVYECGSCGRRHRFLWGPPAPIYVGDE